MIILIVLGTLISPELNTYSTQLIALLLIFYFVFDRIAKNKRKNEAIKATQDEETLMFISTYMKPKLEDLIDLVEREENQIIVKKQLELTKLEVDKFLKQKESESEQ